jgi:hypothetical protein
MSNQAIDFLKEFHRAQSDYIDEREVYRAEYAKAWTASEAKTSDGRKYTADIATSDLRLTRDKAELLAVVTWQRFLVERGRIDNATMPGGKFE